MQFCNFCGSTAGDKATLCPRCKRPLKATDPEVFPEIRKKAANGEDVPRFKMKNTRSAEELRLEEEALMDSLSRIETSQPPRNKGLAAAAYLGILFFVPLVRFKKEAANYGRFHANQGLIILLLMLLTLGLHLLFGEGVRALCFGLMGGILYLCILGMIRCFQGKRIPLPFFGGLNLIPPKK